MMYYVICPGSISSVQSPSLFLPSISPLFSPHPLQPLSSSLPLSVSAVGLLRLTSTCIKISANKQITALNGIKVTSIWEQQC